MIGFFRSLVGLHERTITLLSIASLEQTQRRRYTRQGEYRYFSQVLDT